MFRIPIILGYESLYPGRYKDFLLSSGIAQAERPLGVLSPKFGDYSSPLIDLLNVKYVAGATERILPPEIDPAKVLNLMDDFPSAISHALRERSLPSLADYQLNGVSMPAISAIPPSAFTYHGVRVPEQAVLKFALGLQEKAWDQSGGVTFKIYLEDNLERREIFSEYVDPKRREEHRQWLYRRVDLSPYGEAEIDLTFEILLGSSPATDLDLGLWGAPQILTAEADQRFDLIATWGEQPPVFVLQNSGYLPRAFIVHESKVISDGAAVLEELTSEDFAPRQYVVLEEDPTPPLPPAEAASDDFSNARIAEYLPNTVTIEARLDSDGFLVLADSYFPGWRAYVDGVESKIYVADYILRAVRLTQGQHLVKFVFDPLSFRVGAYMSVGTLAVVGVILGGLAIRSHLQKRLAQPHQKGR